eukprot:scaffold73583_cov35-Tisochrysis_lutea.AAC.1
MWLHPHAHIIYLHTNGQCRSNQDQSDEQGTGFELALQRFRGLIRDPNIADLRSPSGIAPSRSRMGASKSRRRTQHGSSRLCHPRRGVLPSLVAASLRSYNGPNEDDPPLPLRRSSILGAPASSTTSHW